MKLMLLVLVLLFLLENDFNYKKTKYFRFFYFETTTSVYNAYYGEPQENT